jgi:serine/threonine protein kinase
VSAFTYELPDEPHASGAQGLVYFGRRSDGREVAVKVASDHPSSGKGLATEAEMLRACEKSRVVGVVEVLDVTEIRGRPAIVMPRYEGHLGEWLQRLLDAPHEDSLVQLLSRCAQLARILSAVHRVRHQGSALIHRDVKPENIFIDSSGDLVLGDFGGAMAVDGLKAVELAVFGTPMWAPFDQILPGKAMPDPTWDTYALCVILFAGLTGARPAYQADPRTLLTERGRALWETARQATSTEAQQSRTLRQAFHRDRRGATAAELVDFTGRSALTKGDRRALEQGIAALAERASLDGSRTQMVQRACWNVLVRGLSPATHPSPPNRYRNAAELAEQLEELCALLRDPMPNKASSERLAALLGGSIEMDERTFDEPPPVVRDGPRWFLIAGAIGLGALCAAGWHYRETVTAAAIQAGLITASGQATIPARLVTLDGDNHQVPSFSLDRVEVSGDRWASCTDAGVCDTRPRGNLPVMGVSLAQAREFCEWAGGHLMTERQYRAATAGGPWPWGSEPPTCAHAIAMGCDGPAPVGSTALGASQDGVLDLAGNAWEWTNDGVLMGGSAETGGSTIGRRGRIALAPDEQPPDTAGFRCAYDL